MKVGPGSYLGTKFGKGFIVCVTRSFVILMLESDNSEVAIFKDDWGSLYVPAEIEYEDDINEIKVNLSK